MAGDKNEKYVCCFYISDLFQRLAPSRVIAHAWTCMERVFSHLNLCRANSYNEKHALHASPGDVA